MNEKILEVLAPFIQKALTDPDGIEEIKPIVSFWMTQLGKTIDLLPVDSIGAWWATRRRKLYEAYVVNGFTQEEAMALLLQDMRSISKTASRGK